MLLCLCSRWDTFKNLGCYDMHTLLITHNIVVSNLRLLIKRVLSEPGKVGRPRTGSEFWWVMCWVYHEWLLQKLYPLLLLSMRMFFIITLCVCVYLSVCAFLSLVYCLSTLSSVKCPCHSCRPRNVAHYKIKAKFYSRIILIKAKTMFF